MLRTEMPRWTRYTGERQTVGNTNQTNSASGTDFWDETLDATAEMVPGNKPTHSL